MKRLGIGCLLTVLAIFAPAGQAQAHVLQTDGDIGAILHIAPDDNPLAGTPVTYTLAFSDTTGRFALPDCTCSATLQENGAAVAAKPLAEGGRTQSVNTITFPKPDVYTLIIDGAPKRAGDFQAFRLRYIIRASSGAVQTQHMPPLLWAGMAGAVGLVLLAAYAMEISYTYKQQKTEQEGTNGP